MAHVLPAAPGRDAATLIARVTSSALSGVARRALVLRLSRLPPGFARPHHLRLARAALDPLRRADRAEAFELPNSDTAVLWRGQGGPALQASLAAVAELFAGAGDPDPDPAALCLVLDLPEQAETLLRLARESGATESTATPPDPRPPLDAAGLAALEGALTRADLTRFVRRRPVCVPGPGGSFHLAWEKRALAVGDLEAALAPGRSCRGDPWLFRRLTLTLERRVLAMVIAPGELARAAPFALDLTVGGVLGPDFLRFDAILPAALRGRIVLDLQAADILSDLSTFRFARDFAQARGYRLLLKCCDPDLLDAVPPARLGMDLLCLRWSSALASCDATRFGIAPGRVVLAGVDGPAAIAWGRSVGVAWFAGPAIVPRGQPGARTGTHPDGNVTVPRPSTAAAARF